VPDETKKTKTKAKSDRSCDRSRDRARPRREPAPPKPPACSICGSTNLFADSGFCLPHYLADVASENARRARRRGDTFTALLYGLAADAVPPLAEGLAKRDLKADAYTAYAAGSAWHAQRQEVKQQAVKRDPFVVLRLDRRSATVADVRRVQRKLAEVYHTDAGMKGADAGAMAEINQAADEAIRILQKK
jgi:hypothetical protein